jgi:RNA polymerase sigma factor (TIGR02999 family)
LGALYALQSESVRLHGDEAMDTNKPITDVLGAWSEGDRTALGELMELVYTELHAAAERAMARERATHTLQPTALVNEVYLRLENLKKVSWEGRGRQILVEHARANKAKKRGGQAERVVLESVPLLAEAPAIDPLVLEDALQKIETVDPRLVRIIELRFFAGLTENETAEALGVGRATVQREWAVGKRLLAELLGG